MNNLYPRCRTSVLVTEGGTGKSNMSKLTGCICPVTNLTLESLLGSNNCPDQFASSHTEFLGKCELCNKIRSLRNCITHTYTYELCMYQEGILVKFVCTTFVRLGLICCVTFFSGLHCSDTGWVGEWEPGAIYKNSDVLWGVFTQHYAHASRRRRIIMSLICVPYACINYVCQGRWYDVGKGLPNFKILKVSILYCYKLNGRCALLRCIFDGTSRADFGDIIYAQAHDAYILLLLKWVCARVYILVLSTIYTCTAHKAHTNKENVRGTTRPTTLFNIDTARLLYNAVAKPM